MSKKLKLCPICQALHDKRNGARVAIAEAMPSPADSNCPVERARNPAPPRAPAPAMQAAPAAPAVSIEDCDLCGVAIRTIKERSEKAARDVAERAKAHKGKAATNE